MNVLDPKWMGRFMNIAFETAAWSKDPDRKVGCAIVSMDGLHLAYGYNGLPSGLNDEAWIANKSKDDLLRLTIHAETNAIANAAFDVAGCVLFTTSYPCGRCAAGIIQVGISAVVCPEGAIDELSLRPESKWHRDWGLSAEAFREAGVTVIALGDD